MSGTTLSTLQESAQKVAEVLKTMQLELGETEPQLSQNQQKIFLLITQMTIGYLMKEKNMVDELTALATNPDQTVAVLKKLFDQVSPDELLTALQQASSDVFSAYFDGKFKDLSSERKIELQQKLVVQLQAMLPTLKS